MADAECRYKITFEDSPEDWVFFLFTNEEKTKNEIGSLIDYWAEVNAHNSDDYSPCDIMDDLVADHDGWRWESDMFDDEICIKNW